MRKKDFFEDFSSSLDDKKSEMKEKSLKLITELNDYKKMLNDELERSKMKAASKYTSKNNVKEEKLMSDVIRMDEEGGNIDFLGIDEEGYEIIEQLSLNDPAFALSFLERRKDNIPNDRYNVLKDKLLKKMNIKD